MNDPVNDSEKATTSAGHVAGPTKDNGGTKPNRQPAPKGGCGCLAVLVVVVLSLIVGFLSPESQKSESPSYKSGYEIGFIDGNVARNSGYRLPGGDAIERAAFGVAGKMRFSSQQDKEDWITGYQVGYRSGWNAR